MVEAGVSFLRPGRSDLRASPVAAAGLGRTTGGASPTGVSTIT